MEIISPADGKINKISTYNNKQYITIILNLWNKHHQIAPISGVVKKVEYKEGKFLNAVFNADAATMQNEQNKIVIEGNKYEVIVVQIAGLVARRLVCYVKENQKIKKGDTIGRIKFGSQVLLIIPDKFNLKVKEKMRIRIGDEIA